MRCVHCCNGNDPHSYTTVHVHDYIYMYIRYSCLNTCLETVHYKMKFIDNEYF